MRTIIFLGFISCPLSALGNHSILNPRVLRKAAAPKVVEARIEKLFAALDDDSFDERVKAHNALVAIGVGVEPQLEALLERKGVTLEQKHRAGKIVEAVWDGKKMSWEEVIRRSVKAIEGNDCRLPVHDEYEKISNRLHQLIKKSAALIGEYVKTKTKASQAAALNAIFDEVFGGSARFHRNFQDDTIFITDSTGKQSIWVDLLETGSLELFIAPNDRQSCNLNPLPPNAILPNGALSNSLDLFSLGMDRAIIPIPKGKEVFGFRLQVGLYWTRVHDQSVKSAVVQGLEKLFDDETTTAAVKKAAKAVESEKPLRMKSLWDR